MDQELEKQPGKETGLIRINSSKNLLIALTKEGNKLAVSTYLSRFKERGAVKFEKVLDIPMSDRIPVLATTEDGREQVTISIVAALNAIFSNVNLRVGLNEDQVLEIADLIIEQSFEDNFAIEDLLLFGQKFLVGGYGKIYDRMDVPTFFEFFEKYRQGRHEAMLNIRDEQHAQFKSMGRGPSVGNEVRMNKDEDAASVLDLMQTLYNKDENE